MDARRRDTAGIEREARTSPREASAPATGGVPGDRASSWVVGERLLAFGSTLAAPPTRVRDTPLSRGPLNCRDRRHAGNRRTDRESALTCRASRPRTGTRRERGNMSVDTRGREASQRAFAAVDRIDVPDASAVVMSRRRRHRTRVAVVGVTSILVATAGLLAVIHSVTGPPRSTQVRCSRPRRRSRRRRSSSREVRLTVPLTGSLAGESCPALQHFFSPPDGEMLREPTGRTCYILSPVLLTGASIDSSAAYGAASCNGWLT